MITLLVDIKEVFTNERKRTTLIQNSLYILWKGIIYTIGISILLYAFILFITWVHMGISELRFYQF